MPAKKKKSKATKKKKQPKLAETKKDSDVKLNYDNFHNLIEFIRNTDDISEIRLTLISEIEKIITKSGLINYDILFLYSPNEDISDLTADRIYNSILKKKNENLLLILNSKGGSVESAYLISKCCQEFYNKFVVSIPRKAKSAATLIALGAHEIHMGTMSELGPIDPQLRGLPALGLSSAIEHIAKLTKDYPESSEMFAKYLGQKFDLQIFGYFERVSESAAQYAQRLLYGKKLAQGYNAANVARIFVYSYKDHSFVIDKDEAKQFLGNQVKTATTEYQLGNKIHNFMDMVILLMDVIKRQRVSLVGNVQDMFFSKIKSED